jgi:hypothetical protein
VFDPLGMRGLPITPERIIAAADWFPCEKVN